MDTVSVKIEYAGETKYKWDTSHNYVPLKLDQWHVIISGCCGYHTLEYFTNLNRRKKDHVWSMAKPVKPSIIEVLRSFMKDTEETYYTYYDWCAKHNYSPDSMKALSIYKRCLDVGQAINTHFVIEDLCKICDALSTEEK